MVPNIDSGLRAGTIEKVTENAVISRLLGSCTKAINRLQTLDAVDGDPIRPVPYNLAWIRQLEDNFCALTQAKIPYLWWSL